MNLGTIFAECQKPDSGHLLEHGSSEAFENLLFRFFEFFISQDSVLFQLVEFSQSFRI